jgi:hypothetical protein
MLNALDPFAVQPDVIAGPPLIKFRVEPIKFFNQPEEIADRSPRVRSEPGSLLRSSLRADNVMPYRDSTDTSINA